MKTLITSALPYVNNVPHLGNMICLLSADVYSRYLEIKKVDKLFVLGTDEHGTTAEAKAIKEKLTPRQLTDKYFKIHKECYDWFEINPDCFGRSSDKENHLTTQEIFSDLDKNGYINERETNEAYDPKEKKFLADRFVVGTCPHCKFEDARGDQCDNCGKLLTPEELINPKSALSDSKIVFKSTKHLYLDLPKIVPELKKWMNSVKKNWTSNARTTAEGFLKTGLIERSITRDLKWGVKVNKKGFENKVFYSWFDAPIAYISIVRKARKDWKSYWNNKNTELVQFMGKDNIVFHTILFPSYLIGTKKEWSLVKKLSVNEYLNYESGKFSKSRNTGIFCDDAKNTGISSSCYRYYLMNNRPEESDTQFNWDDFQEKINNDLVGNYGNLVNRTVTFAKKNVQTIIKPNKELDFSKEIKEIEELYNNIELKQTLKAIMALSHKANKYFQEKAPWKITDKKELDQVMSNLVNAVKQISILLYPYIPSSSSKALKQLGINNVFWEELHNFSRISINTDKLLFEKLENDKKDELRRKYGKSDDFEKFDFRVAKILSVKDHPEADKLYILKIKTDKEKQIVAGLKPYYPPEELSKKHIIVVNNLKKAKLRGELSEGMLLAAEKDGKVKVLESTEKEGTIVTVKGLTPNPEKEESIEELLKLKIKVESSKAQYKGKTLIANNKAITCKVSQGKVR